MKKVRLDGQKLRILHADLRAARWVYTNLGVPDDVLLPRFMAIHKWFLKHIRRPGPVDFARTDRTRLVDIVKKWMSLYARALDAQRARFPHTEHTADLVIQGTNWSRRLGISYDGLLLIAIPSRYAEYWAEISVSSDAMFETFADRFGFIGSPPDDVVRELKANDEMLVVDPKTKNGIPSFDLFRALNGRGAKSVESAIEARDYQILDLSAHARDSLAALAA